MINIDLPPTKLDLRKSPMKKGWMRAFSLLYLVYVVCGCGAGCDSPQQPDVVFEPAVKTNKIVAVSYALQYMTSRIAGQEFSVDFPAAESDDPKTWSPTVEQISALQDADLIVTNGSGADYAQWLVRVTLPNSKICESCKGFDLKQYIAVKDYRIVHSHGPEGEHSHPYFVPYPWLDPEIAILQAANIRERLVDLYPQSAERFKTNFDLLKSELQELADEVRGQLENAGPINVVSANPETKYLTRFLNADERHLFWFDLPAFEEKQAEQAAEFLARTEGFESKIFVTNEHPPLGLKKFLEARRYRIVELDLLEKMGDSDDFVTSLRKNFQRILTAGS